jgi:hypothetical protein
MIKFSGPARNKSIQGAFQQQHRTFVASKAQYGSVYLDQAIKFPPNEEHQLTSSQMQIKGDISQIL